MTLVTVSPKFQVVIPKKIREDMKLKSGMKLEVIAYGKHIHLIPAKPLKDMAGFLTGIDTTIVREKDRI